MDTLRASVQVSPGDNRRPRRIQARTTRHGRPMWTPHPAKTVTNDPEHAARWAEELDRPIIYKTVGGAWHPEDGQVKVIYTSPVDDPASLRDPSLTLTAHMFQEQITKQYEARSIIVGDQVFTVAIHSDSPAGRVDWRTDYDSHSYEVLELPDHVQGGFLALHRELELSYGACDIALDTEGDWVFFEFTNEKLAYWT